MNDRQSRDRLLERLRPLVREESKGTKLPDDETVLAYVYGEATESERQEVENAIIESPLFSRAVLDLKQSLIDSGDISGASRLDPERDRDKKRIGRRFFRRRALVILGAAAAIIVTALIVPRVGGSTGLEYHESGQRGGTSAAIVIDIDLSEDKETASIVVQKSAPAGMRCIYWLTRLGESSPFLGPERAGSVEKGGETYPRVVLRLEDLPKGEFFLTMRISQTAEELFFEGVFEATR